MISQLIGFVVVFSAGNPFARKKAPDGTNTGSNPFARTGGGKPLNALKSNSFFEKVDIAEEQVSQRKHSALSYHLTHSSWHA